MAGAFLTCAVLALSAIWLHRYPAGIDLPQHANVLQILASYGDPRTSYGFYYERNFFTPYALAYLLGWPLAKIGGALFAVKVLLSIAVLALPLALHRWIRAIGGEAWLSLFGFVVAFGYAYHWGFLSMMLAAPISFAYLSVVEDLRRGDGWGRLVIASALGLLLFFCHGITWFVTMVVGGISLLAQRDARRITMRALHLLPIAVVFALWFFDHVGEGRGAISEWPNEVRIITLFSGLFVPFAAYVAAVAGFLVAVLLFAIGRPSLSARPARFAGLALALLGLLAVPERIFHTWLLGSRFVHYVHGFALGAFDFALAGRDLVRFRRVVFALVVLSLVVLHARLAVFQSELAGLRALQPLVPPGADLKLFPERGDSRAFGGGALGQVAAWIPADQGGLLENDSAIYFQLPLQRRRGAVRPTRYQYLVVRGTPSEARSAVGRAPTLVAQRGDFHLFEDSPPDIRVPGLDLVRYGQPLGTLRQGTSVAGKRLTVGGREFENGLGTCARSVIELRPAPTVRSLRGAVGIDDGAGVTAEAVFKILDANRRELWVSRTSSGRAAEPFEVSLEGLVGNVFLVVEPVRTIESAHVDWLELAAAP